MTLTPEAANPRLGPAVVRVVTLRDDVAQAAAAGRRPALIENRLADLVEAEAIAEIETEVAAIVVDGARDLAEATQLVAFQTVNHMIGVVAVAGRHLTPAQAAKAAWATRHLAWQDAAAALFN